MTRAVAGRDWTIARPAALGDGAASATRATEASILSGSTMLDRAGHTAILASHA